MANGRCRIHGGKIPRGSVLPQFKTGRYSKDIPTRILARFQESQADPELLSLRRDISLLDGRIGDILAASSNSEAGELWKRLKETLREYDHPKGRNAEEKQESQRESFGTIRWLINEGYQDWMSWKDIRFALQERKSLVDSEWAKLKDLQQMIPAERALLLIGAITGSIRRHIQDQSTRDTILGEFRGLLEAGGGERVVGAS